DNDAGRFAWSRTRIALPGQRLCSRIYPPASSLRRPVVPISSPQFTGEESADHLIELPSTEARDTMTKSSTRPASRSASRTPSKPEPLPRRSALNAFRIRSVATLSWYPYPQRARLSPIAGGSFESISSERAVFISHLPKIALFPQLQT